MKKPRLFISMHYLETGGAETSLIGLLHALDPARVEVDLFLHAHRGNLMGLIPQWVRLLPEVPAYAVVEAPMVEALRRGHPLVVAARVLARLRYTLYAWRKRPADGSALLGYVGRCVTPLLPSLRRFGRYDLAISFLTPHDVVLRKVRASRKLCWIHTDYSQIDVNARLELPVWRAYDRIASISPDVGRTFLGVFPSLRDKLVEIGNVVSSSLVRERAMQEATPVEMVRRGGETLLLTIGRYCPAKRLEAIPTLCRLLVERGHDVRWFIMGYGGGEALVHEAVARERMEQRVTLLGKRDNPYPYIQACDWYVQPSRYEGKSVTVREAQILCKPVIITAYPTASSQVVHGVDGFIVPMPVPECAEAIHQLLCDAGSRKAVTRHLAAHDYGTESEAAKVLDLIG